MRQFLAENLEYPNEARKDGIEGRVVVEFWVEKDGSITNVEVLRPVDRHLDAEAVRLIKSMPNWIPGEQRGKPVRVRFVMPINFRL